jgi:hypothetical protein
MIIMIKLIFRDLVLNVISAYAPQVGLSDDVKRRFWEDLEDMIRGVSSSEKLFIGGDLNGHIGTVRGGFERVHGVSGGYTFLSVNPNKCKSYTLF